MDDFSFGLTGVDGILKKFDAITRDVKTKGGRSALRKASNFIKEAVVQSAYLIDDHETRENIAANIAVRWDPKLFKSTGYLSFRVGVLGGAKKYSNTKANARKGKAGKEYKTGGDSKNPGGDTWYWRFIEFGTQHSKAQPFMRPALEKNIDAATTVFITEYDKALDRAIKKAGK